VTEFVVKWFLVFMLFAEEMIRKTMLEVWSRIRLTNERYSEHN